MKRSIFICIIIAAINLYPDSRNIKVNPGGTVAVGLISCDITINIWQKNEVQVAVDDERYLRISQSSDLVRIENAGGRTVNNLVLTIPSNFNVKIKVSAGDLRINGNIKGNVYSENSGGDISFNNVNGSVKIISGGGDIRGMNITGSVQVNTGGGDIRLGEIKGSTQLETGGGEINLHSAQNIRIVKTSGGNISIRTAGGNGDILTGAGNIDIKDASGNLKITSHGGDIRLDKSSGRIHVQTDVGALRIKDVKGNLISETESGDITVTLTSSAGNIDASSKRGTIRLDVPGSFQGDIYARTRDDNWWKEGTSAQENIRSDFKLYTMKRNKRTQEIECTYKINSGGSRVRLLSGNGQIFIKKY